MVDRLTPDLTSRNIRNAGESLRGLLREIQGWDTVIVEDDFLTYKTAAELVSGYPAVVTGVDGSFDASLTGISGEATVDVGDGGTSGDNEYGGQALSHLQWKGDLNAFFVARIKISNVGTVKVEVGFTDAITGDAGAVDTLATYSTNADDWAGWIIDTDDTATWQATGVKATTEATKNESSSIVAPVADTYQYMGVFLDGDNAMFMQWDASGRKIGETLSVDSAIEGGTAVCPWVFVQNRAASQDRLITLDYFMVGQRRS
jgi:hypothetical protein